MHKQLESNLERMKLNSIAHALCTEGSCAVRMPTARWVNCERGCPPFCPNQQKSTHSLTITFRICGWAMCSGCWVCHYHYDWSSNDPSMLVTDPQMIHLCWFCGQPTGPSRSTTSPGSRDVDCWHTLLWKSNGSCYCIVFFVILLRSMCNWRDFWF